MDTENKLRIGDVSDNGQVTIVDEDRLCYIVKSENRGAVGLRTISKALLNEYIHYFAEHPDSNANNARDVLCGKTEIDKFEYGYTSTLTMMAKMVLDYDKVLHVSTGNADIIKNNEHMYQQIFYGAPGTGKSHIIKEQTMGEDVIRTTFHPDTDYSTFVGTYKPTTEFAPVLAIIGDKAVETGREEKRISYEFVCQAFLQAYVAAWKNVAEAKSGMPKKQFLVIEEINRGNCAQIFGDLFQLLDRNDYGYSDYPIQADTDMRKQLKRLFGGVEIENAESINSLYDGRDIVKEVLSGEVLLLPNNLYIWATMNTSDQSLFPIDSAFKRRWDWQYMPISDGGKHWMIEIGTKRYDWWTFIQNINDEIYAKTNSEDKKLGYYFCKPTGGIIKAETFVSKVLFYLWNDVFKDFDEESGLFAESYDKFYTDGGNGIPLVIKEKVAQFMQKLGVEEKSEATNEDGEEEVIGDTDSNSRRILYVEFKDETIAIKRFPQYLQVLQKIGMDKAEAVAAEKQVDVLGCALVSRSKEDAIEQSNEYSYIEADGFFVIKGIKGKVMLNFLPMVSDRYNLNLRIAYK